MEDAKKIAELHSITSLYEMNSSTAMTLADLVSHPKIVDLCQCAEERNQVAFSFSSKMRFEIENYALDSVAFVRRPKSSPLRSRM